MAKSSGLLAVQTADGHKFLLQDAGKFPHPDHAMLLANQFGTLSAASLQIPDVAWDMLELADAPLAIELASASDGEQWVRVYFAQDLGEWSAVLAPFPNGAWLRQGQQAAALWPQGAEALPLQRALPAAKALRLWPDGQVKILPT